MNEVFDKLTYNSRSERYKTPYGAVTSGTRVTFRLRPRRGEGFTHAVLRARFEFDHDREELLYMGWTDMEDGRDEYTCVLDTGDYVGLVWYQFRLERLDGTGAESPVYQLTVYDGEDTVPDWFGQGMSYQIFPDRFRRTAIPDPTGMVGGRTVHQDWSEMPLWRPDEKGEVRNRDFFGGSLKGVIEKLDYIAGLGVETIYFCPIFEAAENHRYGTADYDHIDPMLGTEEDFRTLCQEAHKRGMRIMLDGVFNHTGYVSRYFNGDGFYDTLGALQSEESPYRSWFDFKHWPDKYECWWGIYSLPAVNEGDPGYQNFIFGGENAVVRRWLRAGADGWRLDVADELPDSFVAGIHQAVRETDPNAVVIGEVWEDGTTKIAYNVRRKHLLGKHLDGLMNYPLRNAIIGFALGDSAQHFMEDMETLRENYPPFAFHSAMNALGTHDTLRTLTWLGVGDKKSEESKEWRSQFKMTGAQREIGLRRVKLATQILFTFPGSPTVFYGDEAGMEGFEDPFNRQTYPWGKEDQELLAHYRALGNLRKNTPALRKGTLRWGPCFGQVISYFRELEGETVLLCANAGEEVQALTLDWPGEQAVNALTGEEISTKQGKLTLEIPPCTAFILKNR